jgi:hypothetical protein
MQNEEPSSDWNTIHHGGRHVSGPSDHQHHSFNYQWLPLIQALYITALINCNIYTLVQDVYLAGRELCNESWLEKGG